MREVYSKKNSVANLNTICFVLLVTVSWLAGADHVEEACAQHSAQVSWLAAADHVEEACALHSAQVPMQIFA